MAQLPGRSGPLPGYVDYTPRAVTPSYAPTPIYTNSPASATTRTIPASPTRQSETVLPWTMVSSPVAVGRRAGLLTTSQRSPNNRVVETVSPPPEPATETPALRLAHQIDLLRSANSFRTAHYQAMSNILLSDNYLWSSPGLLYIVTGDQSGVAIYAQQYLAQQESWPPPAFVATFYNRNQILQQMFHLGYTANIGIQSATGQQYSLLTCAIVNDNMEGVQLIINHALNTRSQILEELGPAFRLAIQCGVIDIAKYILESGLRAGINVQTMATISPFATVLPLIVYDTNTLIYFLTIGIRPSGAEMEQIRNMDQQVDSILKSYGFA